MNKITKILSLAISIIFLCITVGCKSCKEEVVPVGGVVYSEHPFVAGGKTDYCLVIPENASQKEILAQAEFNDIIKLSIDTTLPVVRDNQINYTKDGKYIFLGHTSYLDDFGIIPPL